MGGRLLTAVRLVHVDFDTLERTPKESYYWLRALERARATNL